MEDDLTELECGWCKETKPVSEYTKQVKDPTKYYKWCDECRDQHSVEHEKTKKRKFKKDKPPRGKRTDRLYGRDNLLCWWEYKYHKPDFEKFHGLRAKQYGCDGSKRGDHLTLEDWIQVRNFYGCCLKCGKSNNLQCDHIVPLSRGGANRVWNIQPLCGDCNSEKYADIADYRASFPRFVLEAMKERGVPMRMLLGN